MTGKIFSSCLIAALLIELTCMPVILIANPGSLVDMAGVASSSPLLKKLQSLEPGKTTEEVQKSNLSPKQDFIAKTAIFGIVIGGVAIATAPAIGIIAGIAVGAATAVLIAEAAQKLFESRMNYRKEHLLATFPANIGSTPATIHQDKTPDY